MYSPELEYVEFLDSINTYFEEGKETSELVRYVALKTGLMTSSRRWNER
jgi:hypothetical protein